jgi:hypothetical protein
MNSQAKASRRDFLYSTGLTLSGALAGASLLPVSTEAQTVRVRPNIASLAPNDPLLLALRDGVNALKQLPANNPKSWTALARIHNDFCPHGNWFFLPWHRAYLLYYEEVCRQASGNPNFVLPYWDWTTAPRLPAQFWGANNPLMDNTRQNRPNSVADPAFVGQSVIAGRNGILRITDFLTFASGVATQQRQNSTTGRLEATPHNYIHGTFVRGNMATFTSPLDPIFWSHHANLDRLWTEWVRRNPNRTTNDPRWLNFTLLGFDSIRPAGQPVLRVRDTLSTHTLGYRYDTQPATPTALTPLASVQESAEPGLRAEATVGRTASATEPLTADSRVPDALRNRIRNLSAAAASPTRLRLSLEVKAPEDLSTAVRVFLNSSNPGANTPLDDPTFVGAFSFFGQDHASHTGASSTFTFDVTETVRNLVRARLNQDESTVRVSLVPRALSADRAAKSALQLVRFKLEAIS